MESWDCKVEATRIWQMGRPAPYLRRMRLTLARVFPLLQHSHVLVHTSYRQHQRAPSTMRSRLLITLILSIFSATLVLLVVSRVIRFSHIFQAHAGPALTQEQVELAYNASSPAGRPLVIPPIIHQIFHNFHDPLDTTIPDDWEAQRQSCIKYNPDFEYRVRTLLGPLFAI